MALYIIRRHAWGTYIDLVRADTIDEARKVGHAYERDEVEEIPDSGAPAILWSYEYSPDSPRD